MKLMTRDMRTSWLAITVWFWVGLFGASSQGYAQRPRTEAPPAPATPPAIEKSAPSVFVPPNENNRIMPGDMLNIAIDDAPELSKLYRVSAAGTIIVPFLGTVTAQRQTTEELAKSIADALRKDDYLKKPQVTVTVAQYQTESYFVQGAVRNPGVYLIRSQPSLLWLISLAGGLAENHGSTAIILRPVKPQTAKADGAAQNIVADIQGGNGNLNALRWVIHAQNVVADTQNGNPSPSTGAEAQGDDPAAGRDEYELLKINLSNIYQGRFEQNLKIEPGDIVHIPPANVFFVAGEVHAPGSFQLKDGTTLRQAISLAQGTTFKAKLGNAVIFRDDARTGKRQEVRVDVSAVMSGKKEDLPIFANDVIIIPNSRMKSVGGSLLMALGVNAMRIPVR